MTVPADPMARPGPEDPPSVVSRVIASRPEAGWRNGRVGARAVAKLRAQRSKTAAEERASARRRPSFVVHHWRDRFRPCFI